MDKIKTLMLDKIKEEILEELSNEYEIYNKLFSIDYNDYINFMNNNIDSELKCIDFSITEKNNQYVSRNLVDSTEKKCKARIWNNHKSSQCSRKCKINNLCEIHYNMLKKNGKLRFNTIDDPLPDYDNYNNSKLWWF